MTGRRRKLKLRISGGCTNTGSYATFVADAARTIISISGVPDGYQVCKIGGNGRMFPVKSGTRINPATMLCLAVKSPRKKSVTVILQ